jgi:hypothetical protein
MGAAWFTILALSPVAAAYYVSVSFSNPPAAGPSGDYSANPVYVLGETQTIQFTTVYQSYSINLWQELIDAFGDKSADEGPSIFGTI